jgi:hypothetical protein
MDVCAHIQNRKKEKFNGRDAAKEFYVIQTIFYSLLFDQKIYFLSLGLLSSLCRLVSFQSY